MTYREGSDAIGGLASGETGAKSKVCQCLLDLRLFEVWIVDTWKDVGIFVDEFEG